MALRLILTFPDGETTSVTVTADETILGRDPGQGITLPDAKASRRHARIAKRGDGYWVEDLRSVNGILLDGLPLSGQALLTPDAVLEIGDTRVVVQMDPSDNEAGAPTVNEGGRYAAPYGGTQRVGTRFALKVVEGELVGQTFVLDLEETLIGRGLDATLALDATSISRKHAIIRARDFDSVSVEDLGSSNGTYVGELAVDAVTVLRVGEQIRFGTLVVELVRADDEAPSDASLAATDIDRAKTTRPLEADEIPPPPLERRRDTETAARDVPEGRPTFVDPPQRDPAEAAPDRTAQGVFDQTTRAVPSPLGAPIERTTNTQRDEEATPAEEHELQDSPPSDAPSEATRPEVSTPRAERLTAVEPLVGANEQEQKETNAVDAREEPPREEDELRGDEAAALEPSAPSPFPPSPPPARESVPTADVSDASERPTEPAPQGEGPRAEESPTGAPQPARPARMGPSPTQVALQAVGRLTAPLRASLARKNLRRAALVLVVLMPLGFGARALRNYQRRPNALPLRDVAREVLDTVLGYGPLANEHAWRERREAELLKADLSLRDGDWETAQAAIGRSLKQDTTYPPALALRAKIERAVRAEQNAAQAVALRTASRWSQALMAASDALADLENDGRPSAKARRTELTRIVTESRQHLSTFCSEEARVACGQERYENCVSQAACALGYRQDDPQALACLNLAASVTDPKNVARPLAGPGKDDGVDIGPAPAIDAQAAAAQYADSKIRLAILTYAAGSMPLAVLRLRNIDDSQSRAVLADLQALERAQTEAATQEQAGNFSAALSALENALVIDARLIPHDVPSGPRAQLTASAQRMYLTLGDAAFAKSNFEEALGIWGRGLSLHRDFLPLVQALDKLDARAQSLLDEASIAQRNRNKDVCGLIEQAMSITPDESAVHKAAEEALGTCKRTRKAAAPKAPVRD